MLKKLTLLPFFSFLLGCNVFQPPPDLTWEHSPETVIIRTSNGGGMEPMAAHFNRIPDAVVWGDGRIVWQTFGENGVRQVWQGQLSEDEMADLLQTFANKGFWRMKQNYEPRGEVFDSTTTSLRVNLLAESKGVNEYHDGAPQAFHELVSLISNGAGVEGQPYVPQSGYLMVYPLNPSYTANGASVWDADAAEARLSDLEDGWVEGAVLLQAWQIVNQGYWSSVVENDGEYYEIYLQMPELTGREPN